MNHLHPGRIWRVPQQREANLEDYGTMTTCADGLRALCGIELGPANRSGARIEDEEHHSWDADGSIA
jgi:hypothetical protein